MTMPTSQAGASQDALSPLPAMPLPPLARLLHWLSAVLVLAMFASGVMMKQIGDGPVADALFLSHKTAGLGLFCLLLVRLGYRLLAHLTARWRRGAASRPVHALLYVALLLVPLLGWAGVSDYGARTLLFGLTVPAIWPEGAGHADLLFTGHAWLAFGLIGLVVVHIGIAIGDYMRRGADAAGLR